MEYEAALKRVKEVKWFQKAIEGLKQNAIGNISCVTPKADKNKDCRYKSTT